VSTYWLFDDNVQPAWAIAMEKRITNRLDKLMALVSVEQGDLDDLDQALDAATQSLSDKIAALNLPAADLSALQEDLATLQNLGAPAPVEEPPVA